MEMRDALSCDGKVLLALCSAFGMPAAVEDREAAPFTLSAWNQLARQIQNSTLQKPAALEGCSASNIAHALAIPDAEAGRITKLLGRSGRLAMELEALFSRGMWGVST